MDNNYIICNGELYHHGIKGMRWGIRRYQHKDGSLTPAGRKRYDDGDSAMDRWRAKRDAKRKAKADARAAAEAKKVANAYKKKSAGEMTEDELKAAISRAKLEDEYRRLRPEEVSKGKQFVQAANKVVASVMEDQGKKLLGKLGDAVIKKFLPEELDEIASLRKEKEILGLKKDIDDLKNPKDDPYKELEKEYNYLKKQKELDELKNPKEKEMSWDEKLKKQQYEDNVEKKAKAKAEEEAKAKEKAKEEAEVKRMADEGMDTYKTYGQRAQYTDKRSDSVKSARDMFTNTKDKAKAESEPKPKTESEPKSEPKADTVDLSTKSNNWLKQHGIPMRRAKAVTNNSKNVSSGEDFASNFMQMSLGDLFEDW